MSERNLEDMTDAEYLQDLAERIRRIPVKFGVDGYDIDRLLQMTIELEDEDDK